MKRFDVYLLRPSLYVINVQASFLDNVDTRIVIPLIPLDNYRETAFPRLMPVLKVDEKDCVLMTLNMGPQRLSTLNHYIANLELEHQKIVDAIDFLLQGF
jgi:toxin CcdB